MVALAGMVAVTSHGAWAQEPSSPQPIVVRKQDLTPPPTKASNLPVFNVRIKGERTVGELVQFVRDEVSKDKSATHTVNIIVGPGVAELKAPADLDLVNITPLRLFEAIASVEPRLMFLTLGSNPNETTISLMLRPSARDKASSNEIKLRVFRLPTPLMHFSGAESDKLRAAELDKATKMLQSDIIEIMGTAAEFRKAAGGPGMSESFNFRVHPSTRTLLVTGTAEDMELAQEVLTALGATASTPAARPENPNQPRPRDVF